MALDQIKEYIDAVRATSRHPENGISSSVFYGTAKQFGLTTGEVYRNFIQKDRCLSRGKYRAEVPEVLIDPKADKAPRASKVQKVAAAKAPAKKKTAKEKRAEKKTKGRQTVAEWNHGDISQPDIVQLGNTDREHGLVEDSDRAYVWIASPEQIESNADLHETDY